MRFYTLIFKRFFDFIFSLIALIILLPVMLVIGIYIYCFISKNIFFSQLRPGFQGKIFRLYKFRTMNDFTDTKGKLLPDDQRINRAGKILRKLSLDELPELINIINGEMSIIGPRPLLPEYLDFYTENQHKRHTVRPGLTGLAQVSGRNKLDWDTKLLLDTYYAENISFFLDVKIFLKTLVQIFKSDEIDHNGKIMPKFKGSKK